MSCSAEAVHGFLYPYGAVLVFDGVALSGEGGTRQMVGPISSTAVVWSTRVFCLHTAGVSDWLARGLLVRHPASHVRTEVRLRCRFGSWLRT
jgi:hypothetical protein